MKCQTLNQQRQHNNINSYTHILTGSSGCRVIQLIPFSLYFFFALHTYFTQAQIRSSLLSTNIRGARIASGWRNKVAYLESLGSIT